MSIFRQFCGIFLSILVLSHNTRAQLIQISENFYWEDGEHRVYRKKKSEGFIGYIAYNVNTLTPFNKRFGKSSDYYKEYKLLFQGRHPQLAQHNGMVVFIGKRIVQNIPIEDQPSTPIQGVTSLVANLNAHPRAVRHLSPGDCVTIGDMHGNTMKFVYFLIQEGILKLKDPENNNPTKNREQLYNELNEIYYNLSSQDVDQFQRIIEAAEINTGAKFRLIGDLLADRGEDDTFTLHVLNKLHKSNANFDILLSNHDLEFIRFCEDLKRDQNYRLPKGSHQQFQSLARLSEGLSRNRVEFVLRAFEESYLPHLKLLSYDIDSVSKLTYIYSHAPIRYRLIADTLGEIDPDRKKQFYSDPNIGIISAKSSKNVPQYIDAINEKFDIWKKNSEIGKKYNELESTEDMVALRFNAEVMHNNFYRVAPALYQILHSRIEEYVQGYIRNIDEELQKRNSYCPPDVVTVAGHDLGKLTQKGRVIILDNQLGKGCVSNLCSNIGSYDVLHTHPMPLASIFDGKNRVHE